MQQRLEVTQSFEDKMQQTPDLIDILNELAEYLKEFTGATGVYIARLEQTKKEISEGDNDMAHIDESGQRIIKYLSATEDHQFMIDKTLSMNEGVTPDVFNPPEPAPPKAEEQEENKQASQLEAKQESEKIENVVYCKEVTREPRIKYFKVPRLGCYLAVPLVYSSYLFVEALDAALLDYAAYTAVLKRNEELTKEYEEALAEAKEEDEESLEKEVKKRSENKSGSKLEAEAEAEEPKIEPPQLEEVVEPQYQSRPLSFVIGMDTLGQDREFTEEQKEFVFKIVNKFRTTWEEHEKARLISDRELKEEEKAKDDKFLEEQAAQAQEEEDKSVEEKMAMLLEPLQEDEEEERKAERMDEEEKKEHEELFRWECKVKQLTQGVFRESLLALQKYNVIKIPRIVQSFFYLLGFPREDLCEVATNKLFWKKAREYWNEDLLKKFDEYSPTGPKEGEYKKYQTINFIEKNLEGIAEEEVQNYSLALAKLFVCLQMTIAARKADILKRKAKREELIRLREEAMQRSEERSEQRAKELEEKRSEALSVTWHER